MENQGVDLIHRERVPVDLLHRSGDLDRTFQLCVEQKVRGDPLDSAREMYRAAVRQIVTVPSAVMGRGIVVRVPILGRIQQKIDALADIQAVFLCLIVKIEQRSKINDLYLVITDPAGQVNPARCRKGM